jgi:hypothetical protein
VDPITYWSGWALDHIYDLFANFGIEPLAILALGLMGYGVYELCRAR